ncbi:CEP104 [Symbiodinium pilosum]|uniref:CEP104 protein n=1 Tax=Symbiodinium pilosum TaxID=2952 RepID=A0A812JV20_SYMPI|nr:CEP104 [Symbiodinium pilosum]
MKAEKEGYQKEGYQAEATRREASVARTPPLSGAPKELPPEQPPEQPPLSERGPGFDAADHPLSGVPNVEDLSQPEPLNSSFLKEAEPLIELFGEYLTNCVYSKAWSLRDAALQKLTLDLNGEQSENQSKDQSRLAGYVVVLKRMVPDKNVQVFLAAAALLHTVCQELLGRSGPRRAEAHVALDPLMPLLVDRLGDSNARVDKAARDAHLCDLMRCATVGATFTAQYLLRPPKKKSVNPRVYISRMQLLTSMVTEAGIQPESKEGLPLDPTVQLAMDWFSNANADVRESAVKLVAACYAHAGLNRIEKYLANLRQAQREIFDEEFDRVDAGDGLGAGGDLGMPTQRTSRTAGSNRSTPKGQNSRPVAIPEDAVAEAEDVTKCQFCGMRNPEATQEAMDVHYWRECPMLTQCQFCEQVIEIAQLASHWREECEARSAATEACKDLAPNQCPLCRAEIGAGGEQDWFQHILRDGCAANPRKPPA